MVFALLAMIARALMDDFSLYYIAEKMESVALITWANRPGVIYLSFVIYYLFYIVSVYLLWKDKLRRVFIIYFLTLIFGSILALGLGHFLYSELILAVFLLSYFVVSNYVMKTEIVVINAYAALFIFQVAVESMKYLYV